MAQRLVLLRRMRFQAAVLEAPVAVHLAGDREVVRLAAAQEDRVAPEAPVDLVLLVEQARQVAVMQVLLPLALAKEAAHAKAADHVKAAVAHMLFPRVVQALVLQAPPVVRVRMSVLLILALRLVLLVLALVGLPAKGLVGVPR